MKTILKSILAGVMISISCIMYLSVDNNIVGSILFSLGLLTIISNKLYLFTGKIGLVNSIQDIFLCINYLLWNIIGCMITSLLLQNTNIYLKIKPKIDIIVANKLSYSYNELIILGIFCGILMLIAVKSSYMIVTIMAVSVFILCGFEHSVADTFYFFFNSSLSFQECIDLYIKILIIALGNGIGAITINYIISRE